MANAVEFKRVNLLPEQLFSNRGKCLTLISEIIEVTESLIMNLSPMVQAFVLHFGEMGSRWGISRTVGQMYAVLFASPDPMNADQIVDALGVSRSNVSMGLKELQTWKLVRLQHLPDDRRDYFTTPDDLWEIVRNLAEERKKREVDPTLSLLRDVMMQNPTSDADQYAQGRMSEMHDLIEQLTGWYDDVQKLDTDRLIALLTLGSKVQKVLEMKDRLTILPGSKSGNVFGRGQKAKGKGKDTA